MLQSMIYKLTVTGRCYGIEMNMEKIYVKENLKVNIPITHYDRLETSREF